MRAASSSSSEAPAVRERLYRSRTDRMLFGVAGGMAEWLDLDPAVVRLVWALLILAGGIGFLLYIIAAIVVPEEPLEMAGAAPTGDAAAAVAPSSWASCSSSPARGSCSSAGSPPSTRATSSPAS